MSVNVGTAIAYLQLDASAFNTGLANAQSALGEWQSGISKGLTAAGSMLTGTGTALTAGLTVPLVNAAKSAVTNHFDTLEGFSFQGTNDPHPTRSTKVTGDKAEINLEKD